jgi:hypothetical protein
VLERKRKATSRTQAEVKDERGKRNKEKREREMK